MARKVEGTSEKLLDCARKEFLEKGFKGASLRSIADAAGSSTGAIYIRYPNKEALFHDLVSETVDDFLAQFRAAQEQHFDLIAAEKTATSADLSQDYLHHFVSYIYDHYEDFKLVLCCAGGTEYEDFAHDLVSLEVEVTEAYYDRLRERGKLEGHIRHDVHHMLTSAYYTAIFEIVVHDMSRENALDYIGEISRFFDSGWNSLRTFL
jgi:AcrR family transcriptional regulator